MFDCGNAVVCAAIRIFFGIDKYEYALLNALHNMLGMWSIQTFRCNRSSILVHFRSRLFGA